MFIYIIIEPTFDLLNIPWQYVGKVISNLGERARTISTNDRRPLEGLLEIDKVVMQGAWKFLLQRSDIKLANTKNFGGNWSTGILVDACLTQLTMHDSWKCLSCGFAEPDH